MGYRLKLHVATNFQRSDGSVDHSAIDAAGGALKNLISGNAPSQAQKDALSEQMNKHSQATVNFYNYDADNDQYGGELKLGPVAFGGEVHVTSEDTGLVQGYYYDPTTSQWAIRADCGKG